MRRFKYDASIVLSFSLVCTFVCLFGRAANKHTKWWSFNKWSRMLVIFIVLYRAQSANRMSPQDLYPRISLSPRLHEIYPSDMIFLCWQANRSWKWFFSKILRQTFLRDYQYHASCLFFTCWPYMYRRVFVQTFMQAHRSYDCFERREALKKIEMKSSTRYRLYNIEIYFWKGEKITSS